MFLLLITFIALIFLLGRFFLRERRYLKKPTREVLRAEILDELKAEKEEFVRESELFKAALRDAENRKI